ncbi:gamma-glutamyltransferase family protein [Albimonas sp. CAU 1670]|uniref:gamma-glutamyltransferase family protein n=1 Tax=Albimonas sp. CAU 1670 TaxID=3032599 RepID=UPI0023DAA508|nr:gamma-glutamyltransferase family protein [Albimonas sp. CAU 1670]MDF2234582.1 gamma-glutamyltransferase family protein [Albimonas sp. CAU 1670]
MAATSHPIATKTAVQILDAGGNAVDAAIAAAIVCGIGEPAMTGIGGDMFALIHKEGEEIIGLNASGRAPAGLSAADLRAQGLSGMPDKDPRCVTVPGAIDGFCRLAADHGRLGLDEVLAPAIRYAEEGIPAAPRVAFDWRNSSDRLTGAARTHYLENDGPLAAGRLFRAPGQAEVLRRVAKQGRAGFYEGEVAEDMVASLRAMGGSHTLEDFAATACDYVDPIAGEYRGTELVELPPNGHGATAILLAKILTHFDVASMDPFGVERAHVEAEATKLAYDARNRIIGDPQHAKIRLAHMVADETAAKLAALIDPKRAMKSATTLSEQVHKETIYLTVVDRDLTKVSLIYSIFSNFGSGLASDKFGILFQNRGMGFTLAEGHPNEAAGGKRPLHTIIPAMLKRGGEVTTSYGVMGGAYQPCGHARVLSNLVDFGMEPQAAVDAPRCFSDVGGLNVERGYSEAVRKGLAELGHDVAVPETPIGGSQMIVIDRANGVLIGASDPRKDGCAVGL